MKRIFLTYFVLFVALCSVAQLPNERHVVFLKNKDNNPYSLSNPAAFLSQRSIDRRARYGIPYDFKDLPVTPSYVGAIAATGAPVVYPLKWFNAVVVATFDPAILANIAALPFVDHIDQVLPKQLQPTGEKHGTMEAEAIPPYSIGGSLPSAITRSTGAFNYGMAYNQAHMIAVDGLHDSGYSGHGMMIAVLDAGFYHVDQISVFDSLWLNNQILGTRDFETPGNNVFGDDMHTHGTSVLSTMGANVPGQMVGTAPHASFWLVRTEVGEFEALIEEYNWAAGAEFADSVGADIINSSLGYTTFDNPVYNHTYADMDGKTTPCTRAAEIVASRGVMVVNSAGNSGGDPWQYIGAPADGDSVFTIGAVDAWGNYASFSSTGPTSDGRIKPDVTAQGQNTTVVSGQGWIVTGSGTSFSSPVMAGGLACLWQSVQGFSAEQVREAVRATASKASSPDSLFGFGIPNLVNARLSMSTDDMTREQRSAFTICPNPFKGSPVLQSNVTSPVQATIEILSITGQLLARQVKTISNGSSLTIGGFESLSSGIYLIRITDGAEQQVLRAVKL